MRKERLGTRWQGLLLAALGLVMVLAIARWEGAVPPGPQAAAGSAEPASEDGRVSSRARGREEKRVSPEDVPIVTAQDLDSPRLTREPPSERNLFEFRAPTLPPPPTPTPAPPPPCGNPALIGPCPPPPPPPTPAPPEITFKFIGSFGPKDAPIAVLVSGDQTVNARAGDTVFEHFIVRKVGYESVDVGFVGFAPSEVRRLAIGQ
ncbi:MAG: hypothetical protein ACRD1P_05300 [Thermoanaerobaculia bacterium]